MVKPGELDWCCTWAPQVRRFIARGSGGVFAFTTSGNVTRFDNELGSPYPSPNGQLWAFESTGDFNPGAPGVRLYSPDGTLLRELTSEPVFDVLWRPDSAGSFFAATTGMYFVAMPDGQPIHVDGARAFDLGWVGGTD